MLFYIVDAFSEKPFGGNTAGIIIYDNLDEKNMQSIAAELRFSETAFIKKVDRETFDIRFFTPIAEVSLCGHGTIASFGALVHSKHIASEGIYNMNTQSGMLQVFVKNDFIMMKQATPKVGSIIEAINGLADALNISRDDIGDNNYSLKPQIISTGLFDILLPVKSKEILNNITPDNALLSKLSSNYQVVGIHAFTLDAEPYIASCRNFAPLYGINEEAATGTSTGALTYYLYLNNIIKDVNKDYTFIQGKKMNRPSKIITRLENKDEPVIFCGGSYSILANGEFCI